MQPKATNEAFDQSAAVQENDHALDARKPSEADRVSTNAENIIKEAGEHKPIHNHWITSLIASQCSDQNSVVDSGCD